MFFVFVLLRTIRVTVNFNEKVFSLGKFTINSYNFRLKSICLHTIFEVRALRLLVWTSKSSIHLLRKPFLATTEKLMMMMIMTIIFNFIFRISLDGGFGSVRFVASSQDINTKSDCIAIVVDSKFPLNFQNKYNTNFGIQMKSSFAPNSVTLHIMHGHCLGDTWYPYA